MEEEIHDRDLLRRCLEGKVLSVPMDDLKGDALWEGAISLKIITQEFLNKRMCDLVELAFESCDIVLDPIKINTKVLDE